MVKASFAPVAGAGKATALAELLGETKPLWEEHASSTAAPGSALATLASRTTALDAAVEKFKAAQKAIADGDTSPETIAVSVVLPSLCP